MARTGRPSTLTDEIIAGIAERVELGATQEVAALALGVKPKTLERWLTEGRHREDDDPEDLTDWQRACVRLVGEVTRAQARYEVEILRELRTSDKGGDKDTIRPDTGDRKWLLERTRRERYGVKVEVIAKEQAVEHVIRMLRDGLEPEDFAKVVGVLSGEGDGIQATPTADPPAH